MKNLNDLLWKITNLFLNLNNLPYLTSILNISSKSKEHYIKTPVTSKKAKDPEDVKFKIIPHLETLKKFMQTE